jgi:hypothetical protein
MKNSMDKEVLKFLGYLKELEAIEAIGVARFLKVDLVVRNDGTEPEDTAAASIQEKDYDVILSEMIDAFVKSNKNKRKMILKLMKDATQE